MNILLVLSAIFIILGIILWSYGMKFFNKNDDASTVFFMFAILTFALCSYTLYNGAKKQTSDEVLKYLNIQGITEFQIDTITNEVNLQLTPEADSSGWRTLYEYLKDGKEKK